MTNKMHTVTWSADGVLTVDSAGDCVEVQPTDYEFNLRGILAAKLLCWHRLTEAEAQNIVQVFEAAGGSSK